jgi:alpha-ketoglutarate-dependent taurine dioxygenase
MSVTITPIKEHIGATIQVDKAHLLDDEVIQVCREALEDRGVIVFPRLNLTDQEQLAFTDKFGQRVNYSKTVPGGREADHEDVYKVTLDKKINNEPEYVLGTFFWHMDGVTIDQPLPKATMLSARKLSPTGGQTQFASTFAAYEGLPEEEKQAIDKLQVIHRMEASMRPMYYTEMPEERLRRYRGMATVMVHPLVWTQADGRKSLVLGTHADEVVGQPLASGRSLIARLMEWAGQPAYTYSHDWQEGDFVIWNNHGVMHRVVPYDDDSGRSMHRTTIMGSQRLGRPLEELQAA